MTLRWPTTGCALGADDGKGLRSVLIIGCPRFSTTKAAMPHERIESNPDIMGGKPVIRGTRVPVELILRKLGAGLSAAAILDDHPRLTHDDILAAQTFAADYLAEEDVVYG
jgi:uncharacterized protein (DUF433 family)